MDAVAVEAFADTARRFAEREVRPLFDNEGRDGDLEAVPRLMERAERAGLVADEYAVWGSASLEDGPGPSLAVLAQIASVCAGVAACLHFAGVGAASGAEGRGAVAWMGTGWRLDWDGLRTPPEQALRIRGDDGALRLHGTASFVHAPPGCQSVAVYADRDGAWSQVVVPVDAAEVVRRDVGDRGGLAAVDVAHFTFEGAPLDAAPLVSPRDHLRRSLLGLCAISVGNAQGALAVAHAYSEQRRQGGRLISGHAAVRCLLGEAASRISAASGQLDAVVGRDRSDDASVWRAAAARLRVGEACHAAVSDCMQVLGGYGYMEDYRVEKRLRDAMALRVMRPGPDTLRLLCAEPVPGALR